MKLITKSTLPKWIISTLPSGDEEQTFEEIFAPLVIFPLIGIGIMCYSMCKSMFPFSGTIITIIISVIIIYIIKWMIIQTDIVHILRKRLEIHYKNTEDEKEKLKTKKRLSDLCIKV